MGSFGHNLKMCVDNKSMEKTAGAFGSAVNAAVNFIKNPANRSTISSAIGDVTEAVGHKLNSSYASKVQSQLGQAVDNVYSANRGRRINVSGVQGNNNATKSKVLVDKIHASAQGYAKKVPGSGFGSSSEANMHDVVARRKLRTEFGRRNYNAYSNAMGKTHIPGSSVMDRTVNVSDMRGKIDKYTNKAFDFMQGKPVTETPKKPKSFGGIKAGLFGAGGATAGIGSWGAMNTSAEF